MKFQKSLPETLIKDIPILAEVDVLVAGGGAAGVAAAETAARLGRSVLLIEKYGFLGGAAVAGLSGTICGLYLASDVEKQPQQIVFGFADVFCRELRQRQGLTKPQKYGKTWTVTHDPLVWRETAEDLLLDAGAKLLYHTSVIGVLKEEDVFHGVVIDTKAGLAAIHAKVLIDATGDADLIYRAGLNCTMGDQGRVQNPTMIFRLSGVDMEKFMLHWGEDTISPEHVTKQIAQACREKGLDLPRKKIWVFDTPRPQELLVNATRLVGSDGCELNVTCPQDHTVAEILGRRQARAYADFLKKYVPGCEESFINDTGVEVGVRQTRTIDGMCWLKNKDVVEHRKRADGIACCPWPIELHSGEKPKLEWLLDDYYEIPYGALVPKVGENIIVAGRALAAEHEALASARVTAQCFQYGQAAAHAANLAICSRQALRRIEGEEVRALLKADDARLHW